MNLVDVVLVLIIGLGAWRGYRLGLINVLGGYLGYFLSIYLAFTYNASVTQWLNKHFALAIHLDRWLQHNLPAFRETGAVLGNLVRGSVGGFLGKGLPGDSVPAAQAVPAAATEPSMAVFLVQVFAFLLILMGVTVVLHLFTGGITRFISRTLLGTVNRFGGLALGLAGTAAIVGILIGLLFLIVPVAAPDVGVKLQDSMVAMSLLQIFTLLRDRLLLLL